jgi:hypothetical protein
VPASIPVNSLGIEAMCLALHVVLGSTPLIATAPARSLHISDQAERFPPGRCCQAAFKRSHPQFVPEFLLPSLMGLTIVSRNLNGIVL